VRRQRSSVADWPTANRHARVRTGISVPVDHGDLPPKPYGGGHSTISRSALPVVGSRVRYEAERGVLNNCRVRTGVAGGASQDAVVAYIDFADSWVEVTAIYVPRSGGYRAYVQYAAGFGEAQHTLTVNGAAQHVVTYPNTGWDNWRQVAVDVTLNAGWNTLRFQHRTRWAELDFVEVA
jgi:arabinan endo-1,5-alpha-L-arabinosidase